jgi:hypothetical protein
MILGDFPEFKENEMARFRLCRRVPLDADGFEELKNIANLLGLIHGLSIINHNNIFGLYSL